MFANRWVEICEFCQILLRKVLHLLGAIILLRCFNSQEEAFEKSQKYKEGKFILERCVDASFCRHTLSSNVSALMR